MATQPDEGCRLWSLPWEVRQQIYDEVIEYPINFIYRARCQFEEAHKEWNAKFADAYIQRYLAQRRLFRKLKKPCGITYEISPFPRYVDTSGATIDLLLVSKRFSQDIRSAASFIRKKTDKFVNKHLIGTRSYDKMFTLPPADKAPWLIAMLQSGRHIFDGFAVPTMALLAVLPGWVRENIRYVLITSSWLSARFPTNRSFWHYIETWNRLKRMAEALPNMETLALHMGPYRPFRGLIPFDNTTVMLAFKVVQMSCGTIPKSADMAQAPRRLRSFELVYEYTWPEGETWRDWYRLVGHENNSFSRSYQYHELTQVWEATKISQREIDQRGRYFRNYDFVSDTFGSWLVEGTVFKLTTKENGQVDQPQTDDDESLVLDFGTLDF